MPFAIVENNSYFQRHEETFVKKKGHFGLNGGSKGHDLRRPLEDHDLGLLRNVVLKPRTVCTIFPTIAAP